MGGHHRAVGAVIVVAFGLLLTLTAAVTVLRDGLLRSADRAQMFEELARTDLLTGLANRRAATDLVARWGGEGFLVVAPQTQEAEALELAERNRHASALRLWPRPAPTAARS